ncbi:hypothetical protein HNQ51_003191 [Inhella inkyongensis]|uniref:Uncharacterized protein n=1 Tax=Inhella inkyongensis TaxID=392593 RepID=A0A840SBY6_9BURK|nr:hypothetical protein [Inhella inkyongensis]MBB5205860.1 hypothetical protein [Inhella inkyongensis]
MRRLLAARHHADPTEELMRRLWRMEPLDRPGLRRAVIPTMLMGTWAASLFRFPSQLRRHCKELLATGHSTELCLAVAEKYWQVGNRHIVDEVLIFGLAKHSQPLPSHWTDRVQASEARRQWLQEHPPVGPQPELAEISCAQNSELRDWVAAVFHQGEIAAAQARMPTEPQELKALSQRYRQQNRRGMLDSDPAPQTQSASR